MNHWPGEAVLRWIARILTAAPRPGQASPQPVTPFRPGAEFLAQMAAGLLVTDRHGCCIAMVPATVCREPLRRFGYVPVKHYFFGAHRHQRGLELSPDMVSQLHAELR